MANSPNLWQLYLNRFAKVAGSDFIALEGEGGDRRKPLAALPIKGPVLGVCASKPKSSKKEVSGVKHNSMVETVLTKAFPSRVSFKLSPDGNVSCIPAVLPTSKQLLNALLEQAKDCDEEFHCGCGKYRNFCTDLECKALICSSCDECGADGDLFCGYHDRSHDSYY
jgi:hypothetical protein